MSQAESNQRHPFLEKLSKHRGAPPTVVVIFGASGDLTSRKLVPAFYNLALDNLLPTDFNFIGFSRRPIPNPDFRQTCRQDIEQFSRRPLLPEVWERLEGQVEYLSGGYDDSKAFQALGQRIEAIEKAGGHQVQLVAYISTPPSVFAPILINLGESGLANRYPHSNLSTKVIIEKPFGHDLESARQLNRTIQEHFEESQVYRIDHYLGKETVQDLLVQRFANGIFEPIWNRDHIDSVQITVAESIGVGSRGGYYDSSGALRDMIQNHAMQLLALTAMEPPVSLDPEAIRDEKVKVLKAIQALNLSPQDGDVVRAQYTEGLVDGKRVNGYLDEADIPEQSATETYVALRLNINNWRWKGVPFYLRSGKRMARRVSEIAIQFKPPPGILFTEGNRFDVAPNTMVIRIQPDEGLTLLLNSKVPGLETRTQPVKMHFRYAATYGSNTPEAYERLIMDAIVGDGTLFIRGDETETSWKLITPVLEYWKDCQRLGLDTYVSGSWGPLSADQLLWNSKHQWRRAGP
ncbi:MAG: glucose-6-phosphate dehydrogenase [Puniceicoccaceae bacterium]